MTDTQNYDPLVSDRSALADEPLPELELLHLWADEIQVGDYIAGLEVRQITLADHYRQRARRYTLETDPELQDPQVEMGRLVLITDRTKTHKIPVQRPVSSTDL